MSADDPLLDREAIAAAFRRLGDRLARRGLVADVTFSAAPRWPWPMMRGELPVTSMRCSSPTAS